MNTDEFWGLVDKSKQKSRGDKQNQLAFIRSSLIKMETKHIFDFEEILRRKIIECDDFKIMAAAKIINGYVADDSYLYFRSWLIGKGRAVFERALDDPDILANCVEDEESSDFEELLYAATEAYSKKTGREEDDTFPRDVCIEKDLDYDIGAPPTKGEDWSEDDLPVMYPKLWRFFDR
jgi:hypothetical protein